MIKELVILIEAMSFDELRDFIDYTEFYVLATFASGENEGRFLKSVRSRRSGLPTGGLPYKDIQLSKKLLRMTTPKQRKAFTLAKKLESEWIFAIFGNPNNFDDRTQGAVAWALLRGKRTVKKGSEGNIQVRWVSYKRRMRDPDGKPSVDKNGKPIYITLAQPYLYLCYWSVHGDDTRKSSRQKSVYIGGHLQGIQERMEGGYWFRDLANLVWNTLQEHRAKNGRRAASSDSPIAQLEALIMTCVDMSHDPPKIDLGKLSDLQDELCRKDKEG